jgi:carnitine-CoA ligase
MLLLDGSLALTRRFSASRLWEEVRHSGASALNLLSVSSFLLAQPPSPGDRNTRFRVGITAPVPVNAREFEARFGGRLISGYGLSDFGAPLCQTLDMPEDKRQSCGQPLADFQVRLVDDDDFEVQVGVPGEIVLRVDNPWEMSSGYYNQPEATLRAMRNFWFHTGDRAYRDADGYYYFVDRKKDAIRRRGENISTYEVEAAIGTHAAVADVAVYPVRATTGEDDVAASIVLKHNATLAEIEVIRHCERNLPYFAIPRFVHFADELPRTLTQKVKKFELRAYVEDNIARIWDHELIEGQRRRR